jgi:cysteine synthase/rhodanese-related sulfurtransferase
MVYDHVTELIGNTPIVKIDERVHGIPNLDLYAKLEYMNPFGSVKDRAVWGMLQDDIEDIKLRKKTIIEMSSGNTAKAIQGIAGTYGVHFKTITNRIKVEEVRDILITMGAEIEELPGDSDCHDPNDPNDPLVYIHKEISQNLDSIFFTSQYDNNKNIDFQYRTTGEEILNDIPLVDYYFAGLGTTGSSRGPASKIKERDENLEVHGIVAVKDDYIPGIRTIDEMYSVGLMDTSFYTDIHEVNSSSAIEGMLKLIKNSGLMSGPTGGAVYEAIIKHFTENPLKTRKSAVFILCDRMEWYLSYIKKRRPDIFGRSLKQSWKANLSTRDDVNISVDSLIDLIKAPNNSTIIIDTRNPLAFRSGHIPNSINMQYDNIDNMLMNNQNPFPVKNKIVFVCPVGEKSIKIASYLRNKGVDALSLEGGIISWRSAGLEMDGDL